MISNLHRYIVKEDKSNGYFYITQKSRSLFSFLEKGEKLSGIYKDKKSAEREVQIYVHFDNQD